MYISEFFDNDFSDFATYDSYRSIANIVDGLKPTARKVINTLRKKEAKIIKVSNLASQVAQENEYLHGNVSLEGVIVNLAQNFTGTNNLSLLYPDGSFGNRLVNEPAASRYISTKKNNFFDLIFLKEDSNILIEQEFEGTIIEPKFFIPIIPLLFVNGSEGIGTGFAQKILPRNINEIIKYIKYGKANLTPYFNNFKGNIYKKDNSWYIEGKFEKVSRTTLIITELPIGYDLNKYIFILDKLEEQKIINSYIDKSENDNFKFEIKVSSEFIKQDDSSILEKLKLIKKISENITCIDENNAIVEFDSIEKAFDYYKNIRLTYYNKRKSFIIDKITKENNKLISILSFINLVIQNDIIINKKTKQEILIQLNTFNLQQYADVLLQLPIYSLSQNKINEIKEKIKQNIKYINDLNQTSELDLWLNDLNSLEKELERKINEQ